MNFPKNNGIFTVISYLLILDLLLKGHFFMVKITITMTFFVSKLANDDDDNVQTLENIYYGITNGHS